MKFTTSLAVAGFAATAAATSTPAIFVLNDPTSSPSDTIEAPPAYAKLGLAQLIGVSRLYEFGVQNPDENKLRVLDRLSGPADVFAESTQGGPRFLFSLGGMGAEDVKDSGLGKPALKLTSRPSTSASEELVMKFADDWSHVTGKKMHKFEFSGSGKCVSNKKIEVQGEPKSLEGLNMEQHEDKSFAEQYTTLKKVIKKLNSDKNMQLFCHTPALEDLISAHGGDSKTVLAAKEFYRQILKTIEPKTVLLLTPSTTMDSVDFEHAGVHKKREYIRETPLAMMPWDQEDEAEPSAVPEFARSNNKISTSPSANIIFQRCYQSEESCTSKTNACSEHGKCVEVNGCWSCACTPTVKRTDRDGEVHVRTTNWAGAACQKKDISVPFNIFLIFTIVMVLTIGGVITMMFSMGAEPLPSVLAAGVAPTKRA